MKFSVCVLASILYLSVVCSMASLTKPSFTKLHVESSDEFDCPPNILEKLMSQTIRDLFTENKHVDSFLDKCVCVLKAIESTVKNTKLVSVYEYHKSRLNAICSKEAPCIYNQSGLTHELNVRKCIKETIKYATQTLSELYMRMVKIDSVAFLRVIQSVDRQCGEIKRTIDTFYTPDELLESFKCVFNSIDVAVKGTRLTEIWSQYKPSLEKVRGEIEVCTRDQSGEEQQKCVDGKIKEGVPFLDKLFLDMQKKNLHDFLCVLNNVDRNCDVKGFKVIS